MSKIIEIKKEIIFLIENQNEKQKQNLSIFYIAKEK